MYYLFLPHNSPQGGSCGPHVTDGDDCGAGQVPTETLPSGTTWAPALFIGKLGSGG